MKTMLRVFMLCCYVVALGCAGDVPEETEESAAVEYGLAVCLDDAMEDAEVDVLLAITAWNGIRVEFTEESIPRNRYDFQNAALHELGHMLGFWGHLEDPEAVMYGDLAPSGHTKRHLTAADYAAIPADAPRLYFDRRQYRCDVTFAWGDTTQGDACTSYRQSGVIACTQAPVWHFLTWDDVL